MKRIPAVLLCAALVGAAAAAAGGTEAVARVGRRVITRRLLDASVEEMLNSRFRHAALAHERRLELEREQLQELIRKELSVLGALDAGMKLPLDRAERKRREIEKRLGKKRYRAGLKAVGMSVAEHRRALAETLLAEAAYDRFVRRPAAVRNRDVRAAYDSDPGRWKRPEALHLRHILLPVEPGADGATAAKVKERAQRLIARIRAGEPFAELAEKSSAGMYRIRGGDLGWVHRGRLLPELEKAAWAAKAGSLVGPVRSDKGYHILQVVARRPARPMTFEEAAPMIRAKLEKRRLQSAERRWFSELKRRHPVVILDPGLELRK